MDAFFLYDSLYISKEDPLKQDDVYFYYDFEKKQFLTTNGEVEKTFYKRQRIFTLIILLPFIVLCIASILTTPTFSAENRHVFLEFCFSGVIGIGVAEVLFLLEKKAIVRELMNIEPIPLLEYKPLPKILDRLKSKRRSRWLTCISLISTIFLYVYLSPQSYWLFPFTWYNFWLYFRQMQCISSWKFRKEAKEGMIKGDKVEV